MVPVGVMFANVNWKTLDATDKSAIVGRRVHYRLTEKGMDLAPALVEIVLWCARHERTDAPPNMLRAMRLHRERFLADVRKRWANG